MLDIDRIEELAAAQQPGWSLERAFYTDPDIFERERDRLFCRQWMMAGHVAQVPNSGDRFLFEVAGQQIAISRGEDGEIQGLLSASRRPCALAVLEGLIFIAPTAQSPMELGSVAEGLRPFLQLQGTASARIARRTVWPVKANWKLVVENYLECYHCKPAHPDYCAVEIKAEKIGDGSPAALALYRQRESEWQPVAESLGALPPEYSSSAFASPGPGVVPFGAAYRAPLRASHQSGTQDGRPAAPLMGHYREFDGGEMALGIGPFMYMLAYNDYASLFQFVPRDALHSDMIVTWLVAGGARPGKHFDPDRVAWLWTVTSEQDKAIIESNAAGVMSRAYRPGPPSRLEADVAGFRRWYLSSINGQVIPGSSSDSDTRYFG